MEDMPDIVNSIISHLNQSGFQLNGITHSSLTKLLNYDWPGNIRELQNLLERAANLTQNHYIDIEQLPDSIHARLHVNSEQPEHQLFTPKKITSESFISSMEKTEKELIQTALQEAGGNKSKASRILGISRTWLYAKIKQYQLME
jgi:transcriptional regulator with PAS, ATPase and Fis domain